MLTVMRKVMWWGVVENHEPVYASAKQAEAEQIGDPVPVTIQFPIEPFFTFVETQGSERHGSASLYLFGVRVKTGE